MGRSKNRKKRRLGAIQRQMINIDPWGNRYYRNDWCETRFFMWCGLEKWLMEVGKQQNEFWDQFDDSTFKMTVDENGYVDFPNMPKDVGEKFKEYRHQVIKEFTDDNIKGKWYHSKKATYYRNKTKKAIKSGKKKTVRWGDIDINLFF